MRQTFHVPNHFRPADFFDGSFKVITDPAAPPQTVRLRFEPDAAKYIREKIWHPSQHLTAHKDGSATVELSLTSFIEVKRWLLSWGSQVEVLAPETLRAEIHAEALNILSRSKPQTQPRSKPGTTKRKHTA